MANLSDMYCLFRFIISGIFVDLRDVILYEFSWFAEEMDDTDPLIVKTRAHPFTKRAIADIVAFFTICAFFGGFVVLSSKCTKKKDTYNQPDRPETVDSEGELLDLLEDDDCMILSPPEDITRRNPWGDATTPESELDSFSRRKMDQDRRTHFSPEIRQSSSSIFELRPSQSQHSQSTQTSEKIIQRVTKNRDWLIRRTRSGHVYGKYPM